MEKVETKTKQVKDYTHHFYCDSCGIHLGSSVEYDDGWYEEFGEFELQMYTPRGWYKLEKCFCDKCKDEFLNKLYSALEDAEFVLD
jgi:hypothetical protein